MNRTAHSVEEAEEETGIASRKGRRRKGRKAGGRRGARRGSEERRAGGSGNGVREGGGKEVKR